MKGLLRHPALRGVTGPAYRLASRAWHALRALGRRPSGTLVYVGLHRGQGFERLYRRYERCIGIEANPELFERLQERYGRCRNVTLFHRAAASEDGPVMLHVSNNDGKSSSLGEFRADWERQMSGQVHMETEVEVAGVHLGRFLEGLGVEQIDFYVSDIQGMDLAVLRTLDAYLQRGTIARLQCEVTRDEHGNVYRGLAPNNLSAFQDLLGDDYELVARGWDRLEPGRFQEVPPDWWEMDCMWERRG